jgi:hypothetical protein
MTIKAAFITFIFFFFFNQINCQGNEYRAGNLRKISIGKSLYPPPDTTIYYDDSYCEYLFKKIDQSRFEYIYLIQNQKSNSLNTSGFSFDTITYKYQINNFSFEKFFKKDNGVDSINYRVTETKNIKFSSIKKYFTKELLLIHQSKYIKIYRLEPIDKTGNVEVIYFAVELGILKINFPLQRESYEFLFSTNVSRGAEKIIRAIKKDSQFYTDPLKY